MTGFLDSLLPGRLDMLATMLVVAAALDAVTYAAMLECAQCREGNSLVLFVASVFGPAGPFFFKALVTVYVLFVARLQRKAWMRRVVLGFGITIWTLGAVTNVIAILLPR